jgi:uncharacterized protein YbjT (DUF2867 family)
MILLVGGTGNIGQELVRLLTERGVAFKALVRERARAAATLGATTPLVEGDLVKPATLDAALDGVSRVFLLCSNTPEQVEIEGNLVRAAQRARVAHLVKLSGLQPAHARSGLIGGWHAAVEAHIRETGIPFTFLQPNLFAQQLRMFAHPIRHEGVVPTPTTGRVAFVDTRDVAAVAAAVLTEPGHEGRTYTLTGPRALTFEEASGVLAKALARPVTHRAITFEQAAADALAAGLPLWLCDYVISLYQAIDEGIAADVTTDVERLTNRPARPLEVFARDYASVFLP